MRVLLLHNRYRAEGGEERAVGDIAALLNKHGHTVEVLERSSAALRRGPAALALLRGGVRPEAVEDAVRRLRADVVHAHNLHPSFGWRSLAAARAAGARTVLHLHNFRLFCAIGVAYRDGSPCFRCREGDTLPGLWRACRGSVAEAAVYAAGLRRSLGPLLEHTDRFLAVSGATAGRLVELGLPAERTTTIHNFVAQDAFARHSRAGHGAYALVTGRLVEEKGFDTAIAAARGAGVPLRVAGDGPDETRLRALATGADVKFMGRVSPAELARLRARAGVALMPSRWEEPCPYAVLDSLAGGVPVLASDRGGLPELVGAGSTLPADDVPAWTSALATLWSDPSARTARGEAGLERARERFGERRYHDALIDAYAAADAPPPPSA
jgi:glycosyltransferase involved in cell wall biosynthesis